MIVRYRVCGGPVGVDQRLTLYGDGFAELDERHRARDTIRVAVGTGELERVRSALDAVSPERWSRSRFGSLRVRVRLRDLFLPHAPPRTFSELRQGRRSIAWTDANQDPGLADLVATLDEIRVRAVQSQPR